MPIRPQTACATAVLLTMTAGLAMAAPADATTRRLPYRATTTTGVIQLRLTLPAAVPGLPKIIDLTLVGTDAQGFHGATGPDVATAHSYLAGGSLVDKIPALAPLSRTVTADLAHPGTKSAAGPAVPTNPAGLSLEAITQVASSNSSTKAVSSRSALAGASLGSLGSLGLGAVLTPVLGGLTTALTTLNGAITPVTGVLNGLPGVPAGTTVPNPLFPVVGGPTTIPVPPLAPGTLVTTLTTLPAQITALQGKLTDGAVVSLRALDSKESITPGASSVTSTGESGVGDIELFGGLVHVVVGTSTVAATSATTPAAASARATATQLSVTVSDSFGTLLKAVAGDKGITAALLDGSAGTVLDPTTRAAVAGVDAALKTLEAQLQGILGMLGGSAPIQGVATHSVSADGSVAKAHAAPASIGFSLPGAPDLVALSIGVADAVSAQSIAPAVLSRVVIAPAVAPRTLPHTGANPSAALLALGLLGLGGGGVLVRRRRG